MGPVDATCERCGVPILWNGSASTRTCGVCKPLTAAEKALIIKRRAEHH